MAELFVQQGHPHRALAIYRKVARDRPNQPEIARRLAELEALVANEQGEPMSFREHMQNIVESTPGAVACSVMGLDGIPIDQFQMGGAELDVAALLTEFSTAAQHLKQTSEQPEVAELKEISVSTQNLVAILRMLSDEYFMAVLLRPDGLKGKASYLMRMAAPKVAEELG